MTHSVHASAAAAVCDALSRRVAPALDWNAPISRADAVVELKTHWFPLLTADWRARVRFYSPRAASAIFIIRVVCERGH